MRQKRFGIVSVVLFFVLVLGNVASAQIDTVVDGNLLMENSTDTVGNILKGGVPFIHNFGTDNLFAGVNAGNFSTTGFGRNTGVGVNALSSNTTGAFNTASGAFALHNNTTGSGNTASGLFALQNNTTGSSNTAIGADADVCFGCGNLTNATAIGYQAIVNDSNKIRLGNNEVTVVEGAPYSTVSDKTKKENFKPVDGEEVLKKIRHLPVNSWNFIGHDPKQFRHYGPVAQEFFAAFGDDGIGAIGTPTTIAYTDMAGILMIGVQTLTKELEVKTKLIDELSQRMEALERLVKATQTARSEATK